MKELLSVSPSNRREIRNVMSDEHLSINRLMRNILPSNIFIDVSELFCGGESSCPLFTDGGELISYDGGHLTKVGAKYFGRKLSEHRVISHWLSQN